MLRTTQRQVRRGTKEKLCQIYGRSAPDKVTGGQEGGIGITEVEDEGRYGSEGWRKTENR